METKNLAKSIGGLIALLRGSGIINKKESDDWMSTNPELLFDKILEKAKNIKRKEDN